MKILTFEFVSHMFEEMLSLEEKKIAIFLENSMIKRMEMRKL